MRNRLFIFGGLAHDAQSVLTAIGERAFVGVKGSFNRLVGFALELGVASLAHPKHWRVMVYDSQSAFSHAPILAHLARGLEPLWISNGTTTQKWVVS
jgi:hypothetical protein